MQDPFKTSGFVIISKTPFLVDLRFLYNVILQIVYLLTIENVQN